MGLSDLVNDPAQPQTVAPDVSPPAPAGGGLVGMVRTQFPDMPSLDDYRDAYQQRQQQVDQQQRRIGRLNDFMSSQARQLRPWEQVSQQVRDHLPEADPRQLEHQYRSLQSEHWAEQNADNIRESWLYVPGWSTARNAALAYNITRAGQRIEQGTATQNDYDWQAVGNLRARQEGQRGLGETIGREVAKIPAMLGEAFAAGPILRGAGALGARAATAAGAPAGGLLARGAGYAAQAAATAAAVPSLGPYQAIAQGENPLAASAIATANAAVLGSIGRITHTTMPGGGVRMALARTAAGVPIGMAEQRVADLITSGLHHDTGYGTYGDTLLGNLGPELRRAAVEASTFAAFSGQHEIQSSFASAARALRSRGLSADGAGVRLQQINQTVQRNPASADDLSGAVRQYAQRIANVRQQADRLVRQGLAETPPADTRLAPEGPQPQGSQRLGMQPPAQPSESGAHTSLGEGGIIHYGPYGSEPGEARNPRVLRPSEAQDVFRDVLSPEGVQAPEQRPNAPQSQPEAPEGQLEWFGRPAESAPTSQAQQAEGVPVMITRRMEQRLKDLGYDQRAIDRMKPQEAWDILNRPRQQSAPTEAAPEPRVSPEPTPLPQRRGARRPSGDALDILERATQQARQIREQRASQEAQSEEAPGAQAPPPRQASGGWAESGGLARVFGYRAQSFRQQIEQIARQPSAEGVGRAEEMVGTLRRMAERLGKDPTDEVGQHLRGAVEDLIASHNEAPVSHEQAASEAAAAERDLHEHAARLERLGESVGLDKASVRRGVSGTVQEADQAFAAAAPPAEAQGQRPNEPAPAPALRSEAAGSELELKKLNKLGVSREDGEAMLRMRRAFFDTFPDAKLGLDQDESPYNATVRIGDRAMGVEYKTEHSAVQIDFSQQGNVNRLNPTLAAGTINLKDSLIKLAGRLYRDRLRITYVTDPRRHEIYAHSLEKSGYRLVDTEPMEGSDTTARYTWSPRGEVRPQEPAPAPAVREAAGGELGHAERFQELRRQANTKGVDVDALHGAVDRAVADAQGISAAEAKGVAEGVGLKAIRGLSTKKILERVATRIKNEAGSTQQTSVIGKPAPKLESMLTAAQRRGGIDFKSVQTMYGPEEAKRIAAQNPGIFKGGGRPLDALAEEMQRAGELRVPEHLNPADALVQAILEKKPHGNQDFGKLAEAQHEAYQRRQQEEAAQQARETPGEANEEGSSGPGQVNPEFGFRREPQPGEHKFGSPLTPEEAQGGIPGGGQENATQGAARRPMKESALANAHIDEQRQKRGEQPILSQARMSNPEVWDRAMERIDNDPGLPDRLVNELLEKPRATTVEENAILLRHLVANRNEHSRAIMELLRAIRPDVRRSMDSATFNAIDAREKEAERAVTRVEQAARVSGSEWGRAGQFRRQLAAEDYSLSGMIRSAEVAAKRPLSDIERQQIADMHAKITDLQSRLDAALSGAKPPADPGKPGDMADLRIGARKAQQVFDNHLRSLRDSAAPLPQRILSGTREGMDFIRALITSADLSAVFRQGGFLTFSRPVQAAKAFPEMIRGLLSERQFERAQDALAQRPNAARYRQAGLYLADTAGPPNAAEEAFAGRVSKATATLRKYLGINAAERAYTGFLNRVRADTFDAMSATLGRNGVPSIQESRQLAHFINVATGRGQLGESGEKAAALLSNVFFSPRYVASRFQLLAGQPLIQGTPATRRLIALEYGRMLAGIGVFYGLVRLFFPDSKIEGDPRSSDFGKVHIGNTRIDPLMGLSQNAVFVSRLLAGQTRSSTTGRVSDLRGARVPYGGSTVPDVITRYVRSKLAPIPGLAVDVAAGRDVVGQPVTARRLASDVTVPLALRDSYGAMQDLGIPKGTAASLLGVLGMGVQTYQRR